MRLLRRYNRSPTDADVVRTEHTPPAFFDAEDDAPPYAILSHTWAGQEEEVTYQDLLSGRHDKAGFAKIEFILHHAQARAIEYAWVDTCCINKHNSTELGKAINLMYDWYANAAVCYVFLADVPQVSFEKSRWFSRGWTLQELVAPTKVEFYDSNRIFLGTRESLAMTIQKVTGIPIQALCGDLQNIPILDRFRWSINRQTKEPEDKSYCMVGLLGVKMLFGYGLGALDAQDRLFEAVGRKYGSGVADELKRYRSAATEQYESPASYVPGELRRALQFKYIDSRRDAIRHPLYATCTWLFDHPAYQQWLDMQGGLLWIKGHPGTGKSTLVKYADTETVLEPQMIQLSFYFNARGEQLEKSTIGMYRALVVQLLEQLSHIEEYLQRRLRIKLSETMVWNLGQLKEMFRLCISRLGTWRIRCFVDALDECPVEEVQDMINFFRDLTREFSQRLMVCVASRYYPTLSIKDSIEIRLEQQKQLWDDVRRYVTDRLDTDDIGIVQEVCRKANGVFMWAVLVVGLLNEQLNEGITHNIRTIISNLPPKLDGIYREIVNGRHANIERFRLCVQLILFAHRPLTGRELHAAIFTSVPGHPSITQYSQVYKRQFFERFIASSSRGLAEMVPSGDKIQFIHETVRDFLLNHNGLQDLFPQIRLLDLVSWSHHCIAKICSCCILSGASRLQHIPTRWDLSMHRRVPIALELELHLIVEEESPFLEYAALSVVLHAEQAASCVSQDAFVATFNWQICILMTITLERNVRSLISGNMTAIHLFAYWNASQLISTAARLGHLTDVSIDGRTPFCVAIESTAVKVARQLLIYGARLDWITASRDTPLTLAMREIFTVIIRCPEEVIWRPPYATCRDEFSRELNEREILLSAWSGTCADVVQLLLSYGAEVDQRATQNETALIMACCLDRLDVVEILLRNAASIDLMDDHGSTALQSACGVDPRIVKLLLDHGASVDLTNSAGETALMIASLSDDLDSARLLLERNASVDRIDESGATALVHACELGNTELVGILLEHKAIVNLQTDHGYTALMAASVHDSYSVKLLLENGANVNFCNDNGVSPLAMACRDTNVEAAELLLKNGASVDMRDTHGVTALMIACSEGEVELVESLLKHDASIGLADESGITALMLACRANALDVVQLLLDHQAQVDLVDQMGRTALFYACDGGMSFKIIARLVEHGASLNVVDRTAIPLLLWAVEPRPNDRKWCWASESTNSSDSDSENYQEINRNRSSGSEWGTAQENSRTSPHDETRNILQEKESDSSQVNALSSPQESECGFTWSRRTCAHSRIIQLLLDHGVDADVEDARGRTAFSIALDRGDVCGRDMAFLLASATKGVPGPFEYDIVQK